MNTVNLLPSIEFHREKYEDEKAFMTRIAKNIQRCRFEIVDFYVIDNKFARLIFDLTKPV